MSRPSWEVEPIVCLTSDLDWASEEVIRFSHNLITRPNLRVTYFVTHNSSFINTLIDADQVDVGIHPNFLSGSSHGNNFEEVIESCLKIVPKAKSSRSHKYFEVDDTNDALYERGIRYDSNLCTLMDSSLKPLTHRSRLIRFPIYFEDGAYVKYGFPFKPQSVLKRMLAHEGLLIFNVHPIHIALNSPDYMYTRRIKNTLSRDEYIGIDERDLHRLRHPGRGICDLVVELLDAISQQGVSTRSLEELFNEYMTLKDMVTQSE